MKHKKVLIVEDEPAILKLLEDDLLLEGYEVRVARDGEEGLKAALTENPDIVLLDVMLPKRSGYEVCRQIKAKNRALPVILLTAKGQESDKVAGFDVGADDYVTKPFGMLELLARIKTALRHSQPDTGKEPVQRVMALVVTDIKEYTEKSGALKQAEMVLLMEQHHAVLDRVAKAHGGRVVNAVADSSLLVFDSATQAVRASLELLREVEESSRRESNVFKRIEVRLAVHVGELTIAPGGQEVYGEAVNLAARVGKLGDSGLVFLTEAAYLAMAKAEFPVEEIGLHRVKGIADPIRLYRVTAPSASQPA